MSISIFSPVLLKIFFIAEGPGGFIEATNYIRKDNDDIYYAITLLDDNDSGIPGWKKKLNLTKLIFLNQMGP